MRQREDGYCEATSKHYNLSFIFPRSVFPDLQRDWMAGRAFFQAVGYYGGMSVVKLADIQSVGDIPPEAIVAQRADKAEDDKEDALSS